MRSVDPVQVTRFLKERERYELEVKTKKAEIPTLTALPYSASIDRSLLKNLVFMGKFDAIAEDIDSADELTDQQIETFIASFIKRSSTTDIDPNVIDKALEGFGMPMKISNAEARITQFCSDFFDRLENARYGNFRDCNQKKCAASCK